MNDWTDTVMETTFLTILATIALGLMIAVTGGILYLTAADWRDRRRQLKEKRSQKWEEVTSDEWVVNSDIK